MTMHRWTDEDLQQVKEKRVRAEGRSVNEQARAAYGVSAAPSPKKLPYKSKLEFAWALRLEVMKREGEIDGWVYEPFTFKLAEGKRYRVDFISWRDEVIKDMYEQDVIVQVTTAYECKGWHKNYRDSLTHLKWAAQRFPFFQWKKVVRNGKTGFEVYDVVV